MKRRLSAFYWKTLKKSEEKEKAGGKEEALEMKEGKADSETGLAREFGG